MSVRYRYDIINKHGAEESLSGVFDTPELAQIWYDKNAHYWTDKGKTLVLNPVKYEKSNPDGKKLKAAETTEA